MKNMQNMEKIREFWNKHDDGEKKIIVEEINKKYNGAYPAERVHQFDFDHLNQQLQNDLQKYWNNVIKPQEGMQQTHYDGVVEEALPASFKCPRCVTGEVRQVFSKRGIHYKCQNHKCQWDSNRPFDFDKKSRAKHILNCAKTLKHIFGEFNFVTNFPYSPDMPLTGEVREGKTNYDLSVFFMGRKLQRIRVEINQRLTKEQFYKSNYCYVIGIPAVVEYLAKRKGLVIHYLVDEPKERILASRMDKVVAHCPMEEDNFGNQQYFIPKEIRPLIVEDDLTEIRRMLTADFQKILYRKIEII